MRGKSCPICGKDIVKNNKTCGSMKCAGFLAGISKNNPRNIAKRRYNNDGKKMDIDLITSCLSFDTRSSTRDKFMKDILSFEGAGLFTKAVLQKNRQNNFLSSFYSIDLDPEIIKSAKEDAKLCRRKNTPSFICTTLYKFLRKNKKIFNFVWLDYCSNFNMDVCRDIDLLTKRLSKRNFVFITLYRARERIFDKQENRTFCNYYYENIDGFITNRIGGICFYINRYVNNGSPMVTMGFCSKDIYDDLRLDSTQVGKGTVFSRKKPGKSVIRKFILFPRIISAIKYEEHKESLRDVRKKILVDSLNDFQINRL